MACKVLFPAADAVGSAAAGGGADSDGGWNQVCNCSCVACRSSCLSSRIGTGTFDFDW